MLAVLLQLSAGGVTVLRKPVLRGADVDRLPGRGHGVQLQSSIDHAVHHPAPGPVIGLQALGLGQVERRQHAVSVAGQPSRRRPLPGFAARGVGEPRDERTEVTTQLILPIRVDAHGGRRGELVGGVLDGLLDCSPLLGLAVLASARQDQGKRAR